MPLELAGGSVLANGWLKIPWYVDQSSDFLQLNVCGERLLMRDPDDCYSKNCMGL